MSLYRIVKQILASLARRRLRRYSLRLATERDLDFIVTEVIDGARNGHFASSLLIQKEERGLREQLRNVIVYSAMLRSPRPGVVDEIRAKLWIYGSPKDDRVGYLLVSERVPGSHESELELYQIGVSKDRRRQGHGRRLAQLFIACCPLTVKLYARCFRSSQVMFLLRCSP